MLNSMVYSSLTCFSNLFLNNGIMFASFHSNGTIPSSNDKLNTVASGMLICSTISRTNQHTACNSVQAGEATAEQMHVMSGEQENIQRSRSRDEADQVNYVITRRIKRNQPLSAHFAHTSMH